MEENKNDVELEGMMAQEPSLAEMPLTELKEVDYTFGNRDFGYPHTTLAEFINADKYPDNNPAMLSHTSIFSR